jgi:hypothetical protein
MAELIENHLPVVKFDGLNTNKAVVLGSTLAVTGVATFTAAPVFTAAPSGPTTRPTSSSALVGATVVLTAADSGKLLINRSTSGSPSWTLPAAADGLWFTFYTANTTAGFTVTGGTIFARASATGASVTGTTLTNTQATAVIGDNITLVCNGTDWKGIGQNGVFAAA